MSALAGAGVAMRSMSALAGAGVAMALTIFGCGRILPAAPTLAPTANGEEHMPSPASICLTADPAVAADIVQVSLTTPDPGTFNRVAAFEAGTIIRAGFGVSEGPYRLTVDDGTCARDIVLGPEQEADISLRFGGDGRCVLEVGRVHVGDGGHLDSGTLTAPVTVQGHDLLVSVRSLDIPANPIPEAVPPDEGGLAIVEPLWAGRYQVLLWKLGGVIDRTTVTIDPTGQAGRIVAITLDGQPGDHLPSVMPGR